MCTPCLTLPQKSGKRSLFLLPPDQYRAPTEVAPSTPVPPDEEKPCIPDTPKFDPDSGGSPPDEPAIGVATKIEASDGVTQTPPLLFYPRSPGTDRS